ncbi:MAG: hypothetical protein OSJ46_07605 [Duncaniella sp.]|nr:hypothetical protein [Duncaniella sp.]HBI59044.1 hypothetical protein [Porphyromonadaceae bacterium]
MDFSFSDLNFNSVVIDNFAMLPSIENLPGFEARAAFTVNSATAFREDVDIMPTIVDDSLSYIPWSGDNLMPFKIIEHIKKDDPPPLVRCSMAYLLSRTVVPTYG